MTCALFTRVLLGLSSRSINKPCLAALLWPVPCFEPTPETRTLFLLTHCYEGSCRSCRTLSSPHLFFPSSVISYSSSLWELLVFRHRYWPPVRVLTRYVLSGSHYEHLLCTIAMFPFKRWTLPISLLFVSLSRSLSRPLSSLPLLLATEAGLLPSLSAFPIPFPPIKTLPVSSVASHLSHTTF